MMNGLDHDQLIAAGIGMAFAVLLGAWWLKSYIQNSENRRRVRLLKARFHDKAIKAVR